MLLDHLSATLVFHLNLLLKFVMDNVTKNISRVDVSDLIKSATQEMVRKISESSNAVSAQVREVQRRLENLEKSQAQGKRAESNDLESLKITVAELNKKYERVLKKNEDLERELRSKTTVIERLQGQVGRLEDSNAITSVRLDDVSGVDSNSKVSYNGVLIWKIDDFNRKRQEAISGTMTAIYSPHFYSSQFGYKMCVRIYINGDGFGKGTHISLFFVVMKGEYDALLPWPFQKKITMMILDQTTGDHMIDAFRSDPDSSSFQRPKNKLNIASGSPLFLPLETLDNRGYVKDDTMFVKIIVD